MARSNKRFPHIEVSFSRRLYHDEVAAFQGIAQGTQPVSIRLQYSLPAFSDTWFDQQATASLQGERLSGTVDFRQLVDNSYLMKVTVANAAGATNCAQFTWIKDSMPLKVIFNPRSWWPGKNTVDGMFQNPSIREIILYPGKVSAELDHAQRIFHAEIMLHSGDKEISADVLDAGGRVQRFTQPISVSPAPSLQIQSDADSFLPGSGQLTLTLTSDVIQEPVPWEIRIENQDSILLQSFKGKSTLPVSQLWDGKDTQSELVEGGLRYFLIGEVALPSGQALKTEPKQVQAQLAVTTVKKRTTIKLASSFLFEEGKADVKPDYLYIFDEVAKILAGYPNAKIVIEGHTDNTRISTERYPSNLQLSEARALIVMDYLARHAGVAADRLSAAGYGATRPVATNQTAEGRSRNRRVEIAIME